MSVAKDTHLRTKRPRSAAGEDANLEAAAALHTEPGADTAAAALPRKLTRKERHKQEMSAKLERQLKKVEAQRQYLQRLAKEQHIDTTEGAPGVTPTTDDAAAAPEQPTGHAEAARAEAAALKLRHDPEYVGGTFWRTRKAQKARTLFVGNVPVSYNNGRLTTLIDTTLRQKAAVVEGIDLQGDPLASAVEQVDFLFTKPRAKVKHAYVVLKNLDAAYKTCEVLDGLKLVDGGTKRDNALRVNFSADKNQRSEAIEKREGSKHLAGGRGGGGGRGFGGRGRGGGGGGRGFGRRDA